MSDELNWYVVYVASRQEKVSYKMLESSGIEVYLPIVRRLRQWSDRRKWVDFPMFPGYLFVRPEFMRRDEVLKVPGVLRYLRYNGMDATVTEEEVRSIRNIEKSGYSVEAITTPPDLEIGDLLEVTEGPLRGQLVRLWQKKNRKDVVVVLESIGQAMRIDMPGQILRKMG